MKILLVNHTLDSYAGSETFTYALAVELQRQGHDCVCFSPILGPLADHLIAEGIRVTDDLATVDDDIDVIHGHHRYESFLAYARFPDKPMILVCHGIFPWQEQPLGSRLNIFRYVAVSEEVKNHLAETHSIDSRQTVVIPNGIDLTRFYPRKPIEAAPRRALIISNNMPEAQRAVIRRACERLDIDLTLLGGIGKPVWNVEDYINEADIVFSLGRGALEAMACARAVIVCGYSGADGLVVPENFHVLREKNFSGRSGRFEYGESDVVGEIKRYDPAVPDRLLEYVENDHNIQTVARRYLKLYQCAVDESETNSASTHAVRYQALKEVIAEAESDKRRCEEAQARLTHTAQQAGQLREEVTRLGRELARLRQDNTRLQRFADAVRRTLPYRFYRRFIKPLGLFDG
jgi:glycosyltransferase involved in cell wall biosynthesis